MWWRLPPTMMKGWFDRAPAYGAAYTSKKRFEKGRFVGKRAMLSVTVGASHATYEHDGRSGDIDLMLWPVNFSLAYVGYDVHAPFVAYGVEAGLRYFDPVVVEARLRDIVADFRAAELVGGRALVVKAIDDEAGAFWRRRGFRPSRDDDKLLFRSIADVAEALREAGTD
jgi:NAD(P)H dehydrogenase (quinone)